MLEVLPFGEDPDLLVSVALMLSQLLPPWDGQGWARMKICGVGQNSSVICLFVSCVFALFSLLLCMKSLVVALHEKYATERRIHS